MRRSLPQGRLQELRRVPLLEGLSDKELARLDALVATVTAEAGTKLVTAGTVAREVFIIVSGTADVTLKGRRIATLGPGEIFGEVGMLDLSPRTATVTARERMELLVVGPNGFADFLSIAPVTARMLRSMASRLRLAQSTMSLVNAISIGI